jgi:hypothetical protein
MRHHTPPQQNQKINLYPIPLKKIVILSEGKAEPKDLHLPLGLHLLFCLSSRSESKGSASRPMQHQPGAPSSRGLIAQGGVSRKARPHSSPR